MNAVMTVKEVAEYLKIDASTVTRLAKKGDLPGKKVGYLWRFNRAVIDAWLGVSSATENTQ
jgi:excisionase family DNA binding protein